MPPTTRARQRPSVASLRRPYDGQRPASNETSVVRRTPRYAPLPITLNRVRRRPQVVTYSTRRLRSAPGVLTSPLLRHTRNRIRRRIVDMAAYQGPDGMCVTGTDPPALAQLLSPPRREDAGDADRPTERPSEQEEACQPTHVAILFTRNILLIALP